MQQDAKPVEFDDDPPKYTPEQVSAFKELAKRNEADYRLVRTASVRRLNVSYAELDERVESYRLSLTEQMARLHNPVDEERELFRQPVPEPEPVDESGPFTETKPWPRPVEGSKLLKRVRKLLRRLVVMIPPVEVAVSLWILHTWLMEWIRCSPFANISAPQRRCGKTTLLAVMSRLCKNSMTASNVTPAALFRLIKRDHPTLCLDEIDTWLLRDEVMRGILNAGHTRDTAYVIRVVNGEPAKFVVWAAKILCGIGRIPETLADRSIMLFLVRKPPEQRVERVRDVDPREFEELRSMMARWAEDHGKEIGAAKPEIPSELNDREADNWESLLAIADLACGEWPIWARKAALAISRMASEINDGDDEHTELLRNIREAFDDRHTDRLSSSELISYLTSDPHMRWSDYAKGRPITPRLLADVLRSYRIGPQTIRCGAVTMKGYYLAQFEKAWRSFLPHQQGGG